jgi:hypothetical protein
MPSIMIDTNASTPPNPGSRSEQAVRELADLAEKHLGASL